MESGERKTMIIVESHFGNTWKVGQAIADAIPGAMIVRVDDAPTAITDDVGLLVLGAPTHAWTMSNEDSRAEAARRKSDGANEAQAAGFMTSKSGLREWIAAASIPATVRVITFDTCMKGPGPLFGRAAKRSAKALEKHGINAEVGQTFWVTKVDQLRDGEVERAADWGKSL